MAGRLDCRVAHVQLPQCFVYIINSQINPTRYYTGLTSNIALRLADHNGGRLIPFRSLLVSGGRVQRGSITRVHRQDLHSNYACATGLQREADSGAMARLSFPGEWPTKSLGKPGAATARLAGWIDGASANSA